MASTTISDFQNIAFWWYFPISVMTLYTQFKLQPNSAIHAEVFNILVNPRWRRRHLGEPKIAHFDRSFKFLLCLGICSSNCSHKVQSVRKFVTFWQILDGSRRHLGFSKFRIRHETFQFLSCFCICILNCSQKAQSVRMLLTFWYNPTWRRPPSWIFKIPLLW